MNLVLIESRCSGKFSADKISAEKHGMDFCGTDKGIGKMKDVQLTKKLPQTEEGE